MAEEGSKERIVSNQNQLLLRENEPVNGTESTYNGVDWKFGGGKTRCFVNEARCEKCE